MKFPLIEMIKNEGGIFMIKVDGLSYSNGTPRHHLYLCALASLDGRNQAHRYIFARYQGIAKPDVTEVVANQQERA